MGVIINVVGKGSKMDENLARIRHDRSVKDYPKLALDDDEYVVLSYARSAKSLWMSWMALGAMVVVILVVMLLLLASEIVDDETSLGFFFLMAFVFTILCVASGLGIVSVHNGNKLYFTNKRIIQIMVTVPLFEMQRSINLSAISKVDYEQDKPIQRLLGFGTLKLTTHEKNMMVVENMGKQEAMNLLKDDTGSMFIFKEVALTSKDLEQINEVIDNAPKLEHKEITEAMRLNHDFKNEVKEA